MNSVGLARQLGLSKGRISQLVAQGALDGCYEGEGRGRRFDLERVAKALNLRLDPGQMLGNGAKTKAALRAIEAPEAAIPAKAPREGGLAPADDDTYQMTRTAKMAEELRRLKRQNELEEGTLVLAAEVERQVAKVLRQEVAEVEDMIREAARAVADRLGVDFRAARQIMVETWRSHRAKRSTALDAAAEDAVMTEAEVAQDI